MSVLICKNISTEGPGTIEDFLVKKGIPHTIIDLAQGEDMPDAQGFDFLVLMGGPMSVNEGDVYPYIRKEEELVRDFVAHGKGVFGVCLGAQIMAKALGAKVYKGPEKEIWWYDIELVDGGVSDPLMQEIFPEGEKNVKDKKIKVFHWHGETFDIPEGAVRLARSDLYPNQAFRHGQSAYAFQFHIEVKKDMVYTWLEGEDVDMDMIRKDTEIHFQKYQKMAMRFYQKFFLPF